MTPAPNALADEIERIIRNGMLDFQDVVAHQPFGIRPEGQAEVVEATTKAVIAALRQSPPDPASAERDAGGGEIAGLVTGLRRRREDVILIIGTDDDEDVRLFENAATALEAAFPLRTPTPEAPAGSGEVAALECEQTAAALRANANGDCSAIKQAIYWEGRAARLRALVSPQPTQDWKPTHRHVKSGGEYEVIGEAEAQVSTGSTTFSPTPVVAIGDGALLTVYRGKSSKLWCRMSWEFNDGRFERLPSPPSDQTSGEVA